MQKKVLVVYYSQSGQLLEIAESVTAYFKAQGDVEILYEEILPDPAFPFPWKPDEFFQAFPESVQGIPCKLNPLKVSSRDDFDLVILAWQPWYLSPSIPVHSFFQLPETPGLLEGKPVITLCGSRNMWVMAHQKIRQYIHDTGGRHVGNIVLYDRHPNLLSVVSIMHWMFTGDKGRSMGIFPPAGVSSADIEEAKRFGPLIYDALAKGDFGDLQLKLVHAGAVDVKPALILFEKRGIRFFRIWSNYVLKKGGYGNKAREKRLRAFKYYLLTVIYLISPLGSIAYLFSRPFRGKAIKKQKTLYQSL